MWNIQVVDSLHYSFINIGEKPDAELEETDAEEMSEDEGDKSINSDKTEYTPGTIGE